MGNRLMGSIFAAMAVLVFAAVILAQTAKQPGAAKAQATTPTPDLSGIWSNPKAGESGKMGNVPPPEPMTLTEWAQEQYNYNHDFGPTTGGQRGRNELDPNAHCFPPGPTRLVTGVGIGGGPMEIIQSPKRVLFRYEKDHSIREVWMDGREHPKNLDLTWNGHSIGRWDGDTLVVDTIGIRDETWLDGAGHVHSDQLHVVERYRRPDHDTLRIEITLDDPKTFTKPWTRHTMLALRPDEEILEDVNCDERYRRGIFHGEGPGGL